MTKREFITHLIDNLSDDDLLDLHNSVCDPNDNRIESNDDEFFNTYFDDNVINAVRAVCYGNYQYNHKYVRFDGYGNLESTNHLSNFVWPKPWA